MIAITCVSLFSNYVTNQCLVFPNYPLHGHQYVKIDRTIACFVGHSTHKEVFSNH